VATKIRLMRFGKIRAPYYRIVVADARTKRDGRVIETIGKYHPKSDPSLIEVDSERARYWLSVGAQPTEPVAAILKLTGDWQAHAGLPAPEHGIQYAAPKTDRKAVFEAAAKESLDTGKEAAPAKQAAAKKSAPKKAAAKAAEPDAKKAEPDAKTEPEAKKAEPDAKAEPEAKTAEPEAKPDAPTEPEPAAAPAAEVTDTPAEPAAEADAPAAEPAAEADAPAAEPAADTPSES
jgi:small subunit ribosomal protein S16